MSGTEQVEPIISAEEYVRRLRVCLAEVGLEHIQVLATGMLSDQGVPKVMVDGTVPLAIVYRAASLVMELDHPEIGRCCWGCFLTQMPPVMHSCIHGECVTGGPAEPPLEELRGIAAA